MIENTSNESFATSTARSELIPLLSERRLLLIIGDITTVMLAGGLAIWIDTLLR